MRVKKKLKFSKVLLIGLIPVFLSLEALAGAVLVPDIPYHIGDMSIGEPKDSVEKSLIDPNSPTLSSMMFGSGYNSKTGEVAANCIIAPVIEDDLNYYDIGSVGQFKVEIKMLESRSEINRFFGLDTSSEVNLGVAKLEGSLSFINKLDTSGLSLHYAAKAEYHAFKRTIRAPIFNPLVFAPDFQSRFFSRCGTEFLATKIYGGSMYFVYEFRAKSREEFNFLKVKLGGKTISGTFKGGLESYFSNIQSEKTAESEIFFGKIGGPEPQEGFDPKKPDEILKYAMNFTNRIRDLVKDNQDLIEFRSFPRSLNLTLSYWMLQMPLTTEKTMCLIYNLISCRKYIQGSQNLRILRKISRN